MNKETFLNNDVETNVSEEEITLAPPTELFDEAKEIAKTTVDDDKFPFMLHYDANQKEHLLSMLGMVGAIVEDDDDDGHILSTMMNMTQLAFIKRLDCIERVKTDEGEVRNPFLMEEAAQPAATMAAVASAAPMEMGTMQTEPIMTPVANDGIAVASASAGARSSCGSSGSCNGATNTDMASARVINVETPVNGSICCPDTEQWYRVTIPTAERYTIYTTGSLDTVGTLYDESGNFLLEGDDHFNSGKLNFRIRKRFRASETIYIRVRAKNHATGSYQLKVTTRTLVSSISVNPNEIRFDHIGKVYELPLMPNTFAGVENAEPKNTLFTETNPANAEEKRVLWSCFDHDLVRIDTGWYNGQRYQTLTVLGSGIATLYAYDWNMEGKRGECTAIVGKGWPVYPKPNIYSRESWGAREPVANRLTPRDRAPERIIFHHTARPFSSTNLDDIKAEIKSIQNRHISSWDFDAKSDIAYHFLIDPAGRIWEGGKIDQYQRGHANGYFDDIGVSVLGNFEPEDENGGFPNILNNHQKNAMKEIAKWLCYEYNIKSDTTDGISPITTHRSVCDTACPGQAAAPWIENDLKTQIIEWYSV